MGNDIILYRGRIFMRKSGKQKGELGKYG